MSRPHPGDLINIHTHDSVRMEGVFAVENLMIHEGRIPDDSADAFSVGIHPWFLQKENADEQLARLTAIASDDRVLAIGEAGYDKVKGPEMDLQRRVFEEQARLADDLGKPLMIHCVKGWDELWESRRRLKPKSAWVIHGFNGSPEQARQLISGDMYLSLWVKSVLNGTLNRVIEETPLARIFLETDGFYVEMRSVYDSAAKAAGVALPDFVAAILKNYNDVFVRDNKE